MTKSLSDFDKLESTLAARLESSMDLGDMQRMRDEVRAAANKEFEEVVVPEVAAYEKEKARVLAQAREQAANERRLGRVVDKAKGRGKAPRAGKLARKGKR
jgi:hypothetical protein